MRGVLNTQLWTWHYQPFENVGDLKVYSNELFLFQLTNDLCTIIPKIVIILFLSEAELIKKNFVVSIFRAKNRTTTEVLF